MSGNTENMRQRIASTKDLASIVRTMKALAASKISQYEDSVRSMKEYYRTIILGLSVCLNQQKTITTPFRKTESEQIIGAVVFGSDMGLVGQFNEILSKFVVKTLAKLSGAQKIWVVGERVYAHLLEENLPLVKLYRVPNSIKAVTPLVGQILRDSQTSPFYIFHNHLVTGATYEQVVERMLPLDEEWIQKMSSHPWISHKLPEVLPHFNQTLSALIHEYLFVSLFKACTESLAAENASRLAAMQRAEKNIGELLTDLHQNYHRQRQTSIDEELFDIIAGFEGLV